jgi:hypothetical protein
MLFFKCDIHLWSPRSHTLDLALLVCFHFVYLQFGIDCSNLFNYVVQLIVFILTECDFLLEYELPATCDSFSTVFCKWVSTPRRLRQGRNFGLKSGGDQFLPSPPRPLPSPFPLSSVLLGVRKLGPRKFV